MSWSKYRGFAVSEQRIAEGRRAVEQNRALLRQVEQRYDVSPRAIAGIWGMESGFGAVQGDYKVIEALATLAWEGRRAKFFCAELMAALKILDQGHIAPARMLGSWAGAMGQPQFMPTSYLNMAADFDGDGKKDIWTNKGDVFASIANYLSRSGWRGGESWGLQVVLPASFDPSQAGRDNKRKIADWERAGVKPLEGPWGAPPDRLAAIVVPDPAESEAFAVFQNFAAIRRYNPSDYYAAAVGLLGDRLGA
jgi:membrane-bound lytic murein transglycosylase B